MSTVNTVIDKLVELLKLTLDKELLGVYLYGSVVHGDFDERLSDIDLLVVTKCSVEMLNFDKLAEMHKRFSRLFPEWGDRVDLAYVPRESLWSFKSKEYTALTLSEEQKLARRTSQPHWLIDWYKVLHQSKVLFGPEPHAVIPDITKQEFRDTIDEYILGWAEEAKPKTDPTDLAYVVLAICRSMYARTTYVNSSKRQGAEWAKKEFPQFAKLFTQALLLSRATNVTDAQNMIDRDEVLKFVNYVCAKIR